MARLGVLKTETEEPLEVLKWLDRSLIRLICRFGEFKKDEVYYINNMFFLY